MPFSQQLNAYGLTPEDVEVLRQYRDQPTGTMGDRVGPLPPDMTHEDMVRYFQELYRGDMRMRRWLGRYINPPPGAYPHPRRTLPPDNLPAHPRRWG